ncbi:MAG: amidohydrolase family protein [Lachnospiraceae bacterium]|nr:amidohydrolase family protein [Lachnospiraceae bacterium]
MGEEAVEENKTKPEIAADDRAETGRGADAPEGPIGECHAHLFMDGYDYRQAVARHHLEPDESAVRAALASCRDAQVEFLRDGGDHYGVSVLGKQLAPEYGITCITPVFAIHKEGTYGKVVGRSFSDRKEYTALVQEAKKQGADFIKIMTTGIMTFASVGDLTGTPLEKEEIRWMTAIAHDAGLSVMSHTNGAESVIRAAEAGVDSIEHGNFQNQESLAALAEHRVLWVPTTVTVKNLIGCGRFDDAVLQEIYQDVCRKIRIARVLGVQMALGSDAGAYCVHHGTGIRQELESFQSIFPGDESLGKYLRKGEAEIRRRFVPQ